MIEGEQINLDDFQFSSSSIYEIKVQGELPISYSSRFGGMQISIAHQAEGKPVSTLIGMVQDQSELSGVLNSLYELHLPLISVSKLRQSS